MQTAVAFVSRLLVRDDGQDLLEYGLLVVLIGVFALAAVSALGTTINMILWTPIANNF
jgi:Flp pilus assembly pilin Flp